jgi:DNA-binding beta-propeller fold protein YncE
MWRRIAGAMLVLGLWAGAAGSVHAQLIIVGSDEKLAWDDAGKAVLKAPGKDRLSIVDVRNRLSPRIVASLPLENSVVGPPTNLQITPDGKLALVADALEVRSEGGTLKSMPASRLFVVDLTAGPPRILSTLRVGRQPSGLAIGPNGDVALVANQADNSISVLAIEDKTVKVVGTVAMGAAVSAVAISPDGRYALATKPQAHKVAVLDIDGRKVVYHGHDISVGVWPCNVAIAPSGRIALVVNQGDAGGSDGGVNTASVIDMEAGPPRVIDQVVVGDAPEGIAFSPNGKLAVTVNLNGSGAASGTWYHHRNATLSVLKIDDKQVRRINVVEVGAFAQGLAFTPDGRYLYVGNFKDRDLSILRVEGYRVTNTGHRLKLPGHPASVRGMLP